MPERGYNLIRASKCIISENSSAKTIILFHKAITMKTFHFHDYSDSHTQTHTHTDTHAHRQTSI